MGVCWSKWNKGYTVRIVAEDSLRVHLGTFEYLNEAILVKKLAEGVYGYHKNNGRPGQG